MRCYERSNRCPPTLALPLPDQSYALARTLRQHAPDGTALIHQGRSWTFGQLDQQSGQAAGLLESVGIGPGDRVAILARNGLPAAAAILGVARTGAAVVPVNWRLSAREIGQILDDARPGYLCIESSFRDIGADGISRAILPDPTDRIEALPWATSDWVASDLDYSEDAVAVQVYTSGTSGKPKGVLLTNANLARKVTGTKTMWRLTPRSRTLLSTPLFHVGGLSWLLAGLASGATTVLARSAHTQDLLHHLASDEITHAFLVPTQIRGLCEQIPPHTAFPSVQAVYYGAAPMDPDLRSQAQQLFGPVLHHLYGLSETTGAITELPADSALHGSAGKPYPWVELQIRDIEHGDPVPAGTYGEVWTRSAQNCAGYFENPESTRALFDEDGWLRTGDGGYVDGDGNLYLTDRVKDMIITGGENVFPQEVEDALREHPAVADIAVVGVADRHWGQRVAAAIVPVPGRSIDEQEIIAFGRSELAAYKCPTIIRLYTELPRNATGKVLRRVIRQEMS